MKLQAEAALAQVFSSEFREISKNTFFAEHLRTTASSNSQKTNLFESLFNSEYCEIFESTYFEENLRTAAPEICVHKTEKK